MLSLINIKKLYLLILDAA